VTKGFVTLFIIISRFFHVLRARMYCGVTEYECSEREKRCVSSYYHKEIR
jgi:hypothetical protein